MSKLKCDTAQIKGFEPTEWGGLRIWGDVAQVGWLTYYEDATTKRFEYVSPSVLFEPQHMRTIEGATITLDHPPENVTPDNWSTYAKGNSGSKAVSDRSNGLLRIEIFVSERQAIEAVQNKTHTAISMGYKSIDIPYPEKGKNHWKQTKRRCNHIALVGQGRANKAKLHLDKYDYCDYIKLDRSPSTSIRLRSLTLQ